MKCKQCGAEHNRVSMLLRNQPSDYCSRKCYMKSAKAKAYQKEYRKTDQSQAYQKDYQKKYRQL